MTTLVGNSRDEMLGHARFVMGEALVTNSRPVAESAARRILADRYGIEGSLQPLTGEKDRNFYVRAGKQQYVLKFVHELEPRGTSDLHTEAMLHIERRAPSLPVQRVIRTYEGDPAFEVEIDGVSRFVRLVTFIPGQLQRQLPPCQDQRYNIGQNLGMLLQALSTFRHPSEDHRLIWDLKHAADLRALTASIRDGDNRSRLEKELDRFKDEIQPILVSLRSQAIHNDLNGDNIVLDSSNPSIVKGVLDFGDLVRTPLVVDVAVAATYQLEAKENPLIGALELISGFNSVYELEEDEINILFDLILARVVVRIIITQLRAEFFPDNRDYILRNTDIALSQFSTLTSMDRRAAIEAIHDACA